MGVGGQSLPPLQGESDPLGNLQCLRERVPGCDKTYLEEMTHCWQLGVPGTLDKCVNTWLSECFYTLVLHGPV